MSSPKRLTYKDSGINYHAMDPVKRMAQIAGAKTAKNLLFVGMKEVSASRGESAYVVEFGDIYFAFVEECLGTKTLVADATRKITGKTYYDALAQDTIAMMVNDLVTVGARPTTILAYWAMGSDACFQDEERMKDLIDGWKRACDISGAAWGGGESPTLKDVLHENAVDLAGACFGIIKPKKRLTLGEKLQENDAIVLFESSGIHANGVSLARKIASRLPKGYKTDIGGGKMYGEALLVPTLIYAPVIHDLFESRVDVHYISNITGHGWRKIMRHSKSFTYRIHTIPPVPQVIQFICKKGSLEDKEAYGNLNMGAGYAVFVPQKDVIKVIAIAKKQKIKAYEAGVVETGKKQVIIEPRGIVFEGESLKLRA